MLLMSELLQEYFAFKKLRESTRESYSVAYRALTRKFGDCLVEEIDTKSIIQWRSEILDVTVQAVSWNTYVRQLKILFKFAIDRGHICQLNNPFEGCQVRCTKRIDKTLSKKDIRRARDLLTIMEKEETSWGQISSIHPAWFWRAVFETFVYTGIRANELICLRMDDIDLTEGLIRIVSSSSKNHEERKVPIHDNLQKHIELLIACARKKKIQHREQLFNVNVFSMRHRRETMNMNQLSDCYKKLYKELHTRMSPHRFRHTVATELMREETRDIHTVKNLLGHQHISTTMRYISVNHKQMRDLINTIA